MNQNNHKLIRISIGLLILNLLIILLICILRKNLNLVSYFHYGFYVGVINVILGFLVKLGNRDTKASNEVLNHSLTYKKTAEELFKENIKSANQSTSFMLTFEIVGLALVIVSSIIS